MAVSQSSYRLSGRAKFRAASTPGLAFVRGAAGLIVADVAVNLGWGLAHRVPIRLVWASGSAPQASVQRVRALRPWQPSSSFKPNVALLSVAVREADRAPSTSQSRVWLKADFNALLRTLIREGAHARSSSAIYGDELAINEDRAPIVAEQGQPWPPPIQGQSLFPRCRPHCYREVPPLIIEVRAERELG
jgi:hypothetical protein